MTIGASQAEALTTPLIEQPIMDGLEILTRRDGGLYECMVPIDRVDHTDVPVDEAKLQSLVEDFDKQKTAHGGTGQKSPARVGYVPAETSFRIIDGFHRYTTIRLLGEGAIYATVEQLSLDDLLDERIRNANMHDNIRFARTAEWMGDSWAINPLSERMPITSAFTLAHFGNYTGARKFDLSKEERDACIDWAQSKAKAWGTTVASLYQTLKIALTVAPDLIHDVRPSKAVVASSALRITPSTASILSSRLSNRFDHQRLVAEEASARSLTGGEIAKLSDEVLDMSVAEAREYIGSIDWEERRGKRVVSFVYKDTEFFRDGLIRNSSAVRPLQEVTLLTHDALKDTGLDDMPESRVSRLINDLEEVKAHVESMLNFVRRSDSTDIKEVPKQVDVNSMHDYAYLLGEALDGSTNIPRPANDEQARALEDLLSDDDILATLSTNVVTQIRNILVAFKQQ